MWKAVKQENYPIKLEKATKHTNGRATRHSEDIRFKEKARTKLGKSTFVADGARLWNRAPNSVTSALTIWHAKKQ